MKFKIIFLIIIFISCGYLKQDLDATKPAGAMVRLWPFFFPTTKPSDAKALKVYQITATNSSGIITGKKVDITVPFGTNLDSQVATFFKTGVKAIVGGTEQKSGETTIQMT